MVTRTPSNGNQPPHRPNSSVRDICRVLFRHKGKMAAFFLGTCALVVVGLIAWPRTYISDARLFVRMGKESVSLDPTANLSQNVDIEGSREHEINSELEILRSRALYEDVVDRLGADLVLNNNAGQEPTWFDTVTAPLAIARTWLNGGITDRERAVNKFEKSLTVTSPRKSNVIFIKCTAKRPEKAQQLLQAYLDAYMVRHAKANRTSGSFDFFVEQSNLLRQQLETATQELRDAKNKTMLVSINGQQENVQSQANALELAVLANERALASSEAKIAALSDALKELPPQLVAEDTDVPSAAADAMRNELYKLQIQEKEASSRGTAEHPHVIVLRRQVAEMEKILAGQEPRHNQQTRRLSPVHQGVHNDLLSAKAEAAAYRAEAKSLQAQRAAIEHRIRGMNDNEYHIAQLNRKVELLEANYRDYANNREQARIDQALEVGRISNVNVVQPASLVGQPASPMTRIVLAGGVLFALLGAVCVAFLAEFFDPSLKTPEQVEHELGVPVLFSVPRGARQELLHN
ncbi:MAG TPA: GumC family protein [Pirellulales bacterium]|jgi:uncharacterized protein involved in exopolysaccharide biosynthesis|nr:GumC family protein [Pirellulales bacterium]